MTRSRTIILAILAAILAVAGTTAAYAAPRTTHASTTAATVLSAPRGPSVNLAAAAKGCAVVRIDLHGAKAPTITCLSHTKPAAPARHITAAAIAPDTGQGNCNATGNDLIIYSAISPYKVCYYGTGYLGASIGWVDDISAAPNTTAWVRIYYNGPGSFLNIPGGWQNDWLLGPSGGTQPINLTQVCANCAYHS